MNARDAAIASEVSAVRGHVTDYAQLTKPRVVLMVLVTTLAGYFLGNRGAFDVALAINLVIGTALAAGGTLALNQYAERDTDALMQRTRHRPLPDGRLRPAEALAFGVVSSTVGLAYLAATTNWLCTATTASITIIYLFAYTPLKRISWACDVVGAIPGALPPVAGWAAARGAFALEPWLIFAIMFLWQLPHTFAVARLYRTDYARAGIHLLPADRPRGGNPSNPVVVAASLGLIAVGVAPALLGYAGIADGIVAAALGAVMFAFGCAMVRAPERAQSARRLLFASIVYLPVVLLAMVLDRM